MKRFISLAILAMSVGAFADELPIYLGHVKGALLTGLVQREAFEFVPGEVGKCTRKEAMDLIVFTCEIKGAKAVAKADKSMVIGFDSLKVMYHSLKTGDVRREYYLDGRWEAKEAGASMSSSVRLVLWNLKTNPLDIKGHLTLNDYHVFGAVQAAQER